MPRDHQRLKTALGPLLGVVLGGCGVDVAEPVGTRGERVIYGEDDRQELFEWSSSEGQAVIGSSVAALM